MSLVRVADTHQVYGPDVICLIGGDRTAPDRTLSKIPGSSTRLPAG